MSASERLERLVLAHGPPGQEDEVRELIAGEVLETADEVHVDRMGNLTAVKGGGGRPRVMLCAHMDEVGFVVKHIDDEGVDLVRGKRCDKREAPPGTEGLDPHP
jgi:putative aminopeptidase FrvX